MLTLVYKLPAGSGSRESHPGVTVFIALRANTAMNAQDMMNDTVQFSAVADAILNGNDYVISKLPSYISKKRIKIDMEGDKKVRITGSSGDFLFREVSGSIEAEILIQSADIYRAMARDGHEVYQAMPAEPGEKYMGEVVFHFSNKNGHKINATFIYESETCPWDE